MTCKDCIHYCVCKDTVADENWTDEAPIEIRKMYSPAECENFTPTADVAPVIHGRWYDEDSVDAHGSPIYRCSICNKTVADNYISCHKFCLHCGAYMDRGNSNE